MPYAAAADIGLKALGGAISAKANNKRLSKDYIRSMEMNQATNKAIDEANLTNTIRTGYRVGVLNVQRGQAKQQAVQAGYDIGAKGIQAIGQTQANAAASGTTGASMDAVREDIQRKVDQAQGQVDASYEVAQQNFDEQLNSMIEQGMDALQSAQFADYSGPEYTSPLKAALMGAVGAAVPYATNYATSTLDLGLGQKRISSGASASQLNYSMGSSSSMGFQNKGSSTSGFTMPGSTGYNF